MRVVKFDSTNCDIYQHCLSKSAITMKWKCFSLLLFLSLCRADDDFDPDQLQAEHVMAGLSRDEDADGTTTTTTTETATATACGSMSQQMSGKNRPQMAASIAAKAAQVATAANDAQSNAAECAAKEVRIQLAEKAVQASRAVQAVLEGKRALLDKIQRELRAAEELLAKLSASLQNSEANTQRAECAAKSAEAHFARLTEIVQLIGGSVDDVDALNELAQIDYNEKRQMLIAAKERSERIQKDIACARDEYEQVKMAAYQAACAAVEAKQKAAHISESGRHRNSLRLRRRRRRRRQRQQRRA
ncbi:uncharacterized protein LOC115768820 [Drosophila novamexicana]|uniref:uncharacterized protein LOC115768820 n=1 Tax=Drosophila novamexicana TaxID=47314 RepID=UPI0011E5D516|nr:uncharacterized protein LOC115768820 [Drosophila novamexicana]